MEIARGFRARGRSRGPVHAARAYLAGVGTTGSLLAVAALVFIVASALVAFHGWPHVGVQPAPGEIVISPRSASVPPTLAARRLAVVAAPRAARAGAPAPAPAPAPAARGRTPGSSGSGVVAPPRETIGAPARTSVPVATPAGGSPTSCACAASPAPRPVAPVQKIQQTVGQVTNTLGNVVSDTGGRLGSTVQQTTNAAAGAVGSVSPAVGGVVQSAGSGAAQTVTGVTQALGGVVSGIGQPPGSGLLP
jgi:hypothetical protein